MRLGEHWEIAYRSLWKDLVEATHMTTQVKIMDAGHLPQMPIGVKIKMAAGEGILD